VRRLCSTGVPPLRRSYAPLRLPIRSRRALCVPRGGSGHDPDRSGLSGSHDVFRDAPSRLTPESRLAARVDAWQSRSGFALSGGVAAFDRVTRPNGFARATAHRFAFQGSDGRIAADAAWSAPCVVDCSHGLFLSPDEMSWTWPDAPESTEGAQRGKRSCCAAVSDSPGSMPVRCRFDAGVDLTPLPISDRAKKRVREKYAPELDHGSSCRVRSNFSALCPLCGLCVLCGERTTRRVQKAKRERERGRTQPIAHEHSCLRTSVVRTFGLRSRIQQPHRRRTSRQNAEALTFSIGLPRSATARTLFGIVSRHVGGAGRESLLRRGHQRRRRSHAETRPVRASASTKRRPRGRALPEREEAARLGRVAQPSRSHHRTKVRSALWLGHSALRGPQRRRRRLRRKPPASTAIAPGVGMPK
jgi:hypothetical protein